MESEASVSELNAEESWIDIRVSEASVLHPIPDPAAELLRALLRDRLTKRSLRPAELTDAAKTLLASMEAKDAPAGPQAP
jgi:hypothetical protein